MKLEGGGAQARDCAHWWRRHGSALAFAIDAPRQAPWRLEHARPRGDARVVAEPEARGMLAADTYLHYVQLRFYLQDVTF